jgi:Bardet-Biedl syndrome 9 protein
MTKSLTMVACVSQMLTMIHRALVNSTLSSLILQIWHFFNFDGWFFSDKIVTGSFQGLLRIYHPKQAGQQVDGLMLETNLDAPILQLSVGKFVPYASIYFSLCHCRVDSHLVSLIIRNLNALALAVLHPRKLSVFLVRAIGGGSGGGPSHLELSRQYDHKLDRSAYNMCHGPFGGATGTVTFSLQY